MAGKKTMSIVCKVEYEEERKSSSNEGQTADTEEDRVREENPQGVWEWGDGREKSKYDKAWAENRWDLQHDNNSPERQSGCKKDLRIRWF